MNRLLTASWCFAALLPFFYWSSSCSVLHYPPSSLCWRSLPWPPPPTRPPPRLLRRRKTINAAIARKELPGAVLLVGRKSGTIYEKAYGTAPSRSSKT